MLCFQLSLHGLRLLVPGMPGAPGALLAGGGQVLQTQPLPALPVGIWEKSSRCPHCSAHPGVRAHPRVAFSLLQRGVADTWCCSEGLSFPSCGIGQPQLQIPHHSSFSADLGGVLALLLFIFSRGTRAACVAVPLKYCPAAAAASCSRSPECAYDSRLEKTEKLNVAGLFAFSGV